MNVVRVGVIGAAGYTGGELLRLLINHPNVEIVFANSQSQAGKFVHETHVDMLGDTDLKFTDSYDFEAADVIFLCSGHGYSKKFMESHDLPEKLKIIDLSTDFRDESDGFVYGLPELNRDRIRVADKIANPGCFATTIQLTLLPLANAGLIQSDIHISAITGSTGAGQSLSPTSHFSWRNNNISIYSPFTHRHLKEIGQSLNQLQNGFNQTINFIPYRGNFSRGIMANMYLDFNESEAFARQLFEDFYAGHPFTWISKSPISVKQVVGTNKGILEVHQYGNKLLVTSITDNLLKGASGQAVQNMNLMFGLDETAGLKMKGIAF